MNRTHRRTALLAEASGRAPAIVSALLVFLTLSLLGLPASAQTIEQKLPVPVAGVPDPDTAAATLGMEFTVAKPGEVVGVEFYRLDAANNARAVQLWSATGTLLGAAETPDVAKSGWNRATFAMPIPVAAGQRLIASYQAPRGRYTVRDRGFDAARSAGDLTASAGAGVYRYGTTPRFPTDRYLNSDYYVTPVFMADTSSRLTATATEALPGSTTIAPPAARNISPPSQAGIDCMPDPSACGYPDVETTGAKPGVARDDVTGTVELSVPGQVYENKTVRGEIYVTAPNVTIRNVRLIQTSDDYGIRPFDWNVGMPNLLVEDSEIDLNGHLDGKGIAFDDYTLRRVFIHNGADCAHMGDNVVIEDSFCVLGPDTNSDGRPDATSFCSGTEHFDGFQSDGGSSITIRHNTIRNPCSQTAAILMSSNTESISGVTVVDNLIAGGGYALYCNAGPDVGNQTVTGNRFARTSFPQSGYWGPETGCDDANVFAGNVWDDNNQPVG